MRSGRGGRVLTLLVLAVALLAGCGLGGAVATEPTTAASTPTTSQTPSATADSVAGAASPSATTAADVAPAGGEARTQPPHTESVEGQIVRVVGVSDGDSLRVSVDGVTERLRIIGIDAPELSGNECYAQRSASKMQSLVQSRDVRIVADPTQADRDRYNRILRHVFTLDGVNVGHAMILEGLAKEYTYDKPYASRAAFIDAEDVARTGKLGIWGACDVVVAAPPVAPADPAAPVPFAPQPAEPPADTGTCVIKGNINSKKERIYHVPGGRSYDETIIDEGKGERWFCSEQEAVDAGWRKAKR